MQTKSSRIQDRRLIRKSTAPFIALTGAQGTGKSTVAEALKPQLDKLLDTDVTLVQGVARQLRDKGFAIDKDATVESKWAIEAAYADLEQKLRHTPKLFCRSIVDRFAYTKATGLEMDLYFNRVIIPYINEYDVLFYIPVEDRIPLVADGVRNPDVEFQKLVDKCIRQVIFEYAIPVQVLVGTVEQRTETALAAIKLNLGLDR